MTEIDIEVVAKLLMTGHSCNSEEYRRKFDITDKELYLINAGIGAGEEETKKKIARNLFRTLTEEKIAEVVDLTVAEVFKLKRANAEFIKYQLQLLEEDKV